MGANVLLDTMHPFNHKTIFLMDHSPNFSTSSETIEVDLNKRAGFIPLAPINKSLWTCSVEAVMEYCRIVWDLYGNDKLIRIIIADTDSRNLNTWIQSEQNICQLLDGFAHIGAPCSTIQDGNKSLTLPCLISSVQAMCECSEVQHERRTSLEENKIPIVNRCRVICITSFVSNDSSQVIEERLQQAILRGNVNAVASDLLIRVDACQLVIINVHAESCTLENIAKHRVSSILFSETYNVKASVDLANKLISLLLPHYNLFSTTVAGIPMKEGKNASCSLSYDVELFHPAEVHDALFKGSDIDINSFMSPKEGFDYSTIKLKWYAPKICALNEIKSFTSVVHRITPIDVNSRPSQCLINFLFSGKAVMLEVPRGGGKALSHLLSARAGQLYIHSLIIGRSILGNSPSISEGAGGRVTDYRITDFGQFMQNNKLYPLKIAKIKSNAIRQRTRARLQLHTKFWPMTFSSTMIFSYKKYLDPILNLMVEQKLKDSDVIKCKQYIFSLVDNESNESVSTSGCQQRSKGPNKEEQWKQMWNELETFLRGHCITEKHIDILNCFLNLKCKDFSSDKDKAEFNDARKELEKLTAEHEAQISTSVNSTTSFDSADTSVQKTVLELWMKQRAKVKPCPEFAGYSSASVNSSGNLKFKLYATINKNNNYRKR